MAAWSSGEALFQRGSGSGGAGVIAAR